MNARRGFTIIELILYMTLVGGFVSAAVLFAWDVIYGREKYTQAQAVHEVAKHTLGRINYEIKRAKNIISLTDTQIVLDNGTSTTTIASASGNIYLTTNGVGPYSLISNQVVATEVRFTNLSSIDNNSKDIAVFFSLKQSSDILSGQIPAQVQVNLAAELNSLFNQGRSLILDAGDVLLTTGNKRIENIFLSNIGDNTIVIDKMMLTWIGGDVGSVLQSVKINGLTVWSGSVSSGALLDITNVSLLSESGLIPLDVIDFSKNMANSIITVRFVLQDASSSNTELSFGALPTPTFTPTPTSSVPTNTPTPTITGTPTSTPTNTPTPTPTPSNCNQYCQQQYVLPGSCIKSNQCTGTNAGVIYECGPPNICCCQ